MRLVVLGPQRRPTLDAVTRSLAAAAPPGGDVRFATVTAGWLEREPDDAELNALLGGRGTNLALYRRWLDVLDRDREFATAQLDHQAVLDELRSLYLVQLGAALEAVYAIARRRAGRPRVRAAALADAEAAVRLIDERHLRRVRAAHDDFWAAWTPLDRPLVADHRAAVALALSTATALLVAGGHVGVLLRVLPAFGVAAAVPPTIIAWSAGAMALTDRVVLFNDREPQGPSYAEVYDRGLGLIRGLVLLPHARRRLRIDDPVRMGVLARRFTPARCVVLDDGVRLELGPAAAEAAPPDGEPPGGWPATALPAGARVVTGEGRITEVAAI